MNAAQTRSSAAKAPSAPNKPDGEGAVLTYAMPVFAEDVNWCERLILPADLTTADWPAWAAAMTCRIRLASSARQIGGLVDMNAAGLRACPGRIRARIAEVMADVAAHTTDQTAGE